MDYLSNTYFPFDDYSTFKAILNDLKFNDINGHDKKHSIRVLFLTLLIASELEIDQGDIELLCLACINHDRGRVHDKECSNHGAKSYEIIKKENFLNKYDEYLEYSINEKELEFLLTYHCKDDKEAINFIENSNFSEENQDRLIDLLFILKDADALDRVRFGIKALDVKYLRYEYSKKITLIAQLALNNIKL